MPRLTAAGLEMLSNQVYVSSPEGGSHTASWLFLQMDVGSTVGGILLSLANAVTSLVSLLLHPVVFTSAKPFDPDSTVTQPEHVSILFYEWRK